MTASGEDSDSFGYIIIGAGSAGCVLAHRLSAAGSRPGSGPMPLPGNASVRDDRLLGGPACSPRTSAISAAEISVNWFRTHHLERACRLLGCRLDLLLALD